MRICLILDGLSRDKYINHILLALKSKQPIAFMAHEALSQVILEEGARRHFDDAQATYGAWRDRELRQMFDIPPNFQIYPMPF